MHLARALSRDSKRGSAMERLALTWFAMAGRICRQHGLQADDRRDSIMLRTSPYMDGISTHPGARLHVLSTLNNLRTWPSPKPK